MKGIRKRFERWPPAWPVAHPRSDQVETIEELLEAANSSSQFARSFYVSFLLAGVYIAVVVWSTTDVMLLKETPLTLPILNTLLPVSGFYAFAPYLIILLHFNLLLQLSLLADKLHRFDQAVTGLGDAPAQRNYYSRLFPFVFSQTIAGRQHSGFFRLLLTTMVWITMIWLPLGLLLGLQIGFLPYHSEEVLFYQRLAVSLDLLMLIVFWPIIRSPQGKGLSWLLQLTFLPALFAWLRRGLPGGRDITGARRQRKTTGYPWLEGGLGLITLFSVATFTWGVAVLPDSHYQQVAGHWAQRIDQWQQRWEGRKSEGTEQEKQPDGKDGDRSSLWLSRKVDAGGQHYFRLTEYLFDDIVEYGEGTASFFHRNLQLTETLLIANKLKPRDIEALRRGDKEDREAAMREVEAFNLRGRDLRYADFSEALLPKVDFRPHRKSKRSTQLQGAIFTWAQLQGADLYGAELQGAGLREVQLQGAKLFGAELKGADLREAQLDHAILAGLQFGKLNTELAEDIITALNAISWNAISWNAIIERAIARLQVATERSTNWEGAEGEKIIIDPNDQALKHVFDKSDKRLTYIDTGRGICAALQATSYVGL
jgi:hypothetical protein